MLRESLKIDSVYDKTYRSRSKVYFSEVAVQPVFEAMYLSKDNIIFAAECSTCQFMKIAIKYDGRENIFSCLFNVHNTISFSRYEKVCLIRLRFEICLFMKCKLILCFIEVY